MWSRLRCPSARRERLAIAGFLVVAFGCGSEKSSTEPNSRTEVPRLVTQRQLEEWKAGGVEEEVAKDSSHTGISRAVFSSTDSTGATVLTFDFEGLGQMQLVDETFAIYGLHLTNAEAYFTYNSGSFPAHSDSTVITAVIPPSGPGSGLVGVTFDSVLTGFGVYVTTVEPLNLTCFDAANAPLGSVDLQENLSSPNTLLVVRAAGIVRCDIAGPNNGYSLDDFQLTMQLSQRLVVSCPDSIQRGDVIRCTGRLVVPVAYTQKVLFAQGVGFINEDTVSVAHAAGDSIVWEGDAAASTFVSMTVEVPASGDTTSYLDSTSFAVTNRAWAPLATPNANPRYDTLPDNSAMRAYPDNRVLGYWLTKLGPNGGKVIASGPNAGLAYYTVAWSYKQADAFVHPSLVTVPLPVPPYRAWYDDQNGGPMHRCKKTIVPTVRTFVERHEGVTLATPNSHWAIEAAFYQANDIGALIEPLYIAGNGGQLLTLAGTTLGQGLQALQTQQSGFDSADIPAFEASLGCTLDFNPNDN